MLHVYNGTAFVEPAGLYRWDGDEWVDADGYRWDGAEWVPIFRRAIPLADDFDRPDGVLGMTSVGDREWESLSGSWSIDGGRARPSGEGSAAVVEAHTPDVDISLDISTGGQDAIVFRASDADNYWLVERYQNRSWSTFCTNEYEYRKRCEYLYDAGTYEELVTRYPTKCGSCPSCPSYSNADFVGSGPCENTGEVCDTSCSTSTTTRHRIYLRQMSGGSLSTVDWWDVSSSLDRLRVRAVGDTIEVYTSDTTVRAVDGQDFNRNATRHGIGRGTTGNRSGTAIDNFELTPVE